MRSVNRVTIIGNVVKDSIGKKASSGHDFTSFVIATNREWSSLTGGSKSLVEFHKVVAWGKLAELCSRYIKKGKFIYIEGYLKTRSWDENGVKMYRTEIVAQDMIMLNKRGDFDSGNNYEEEFYDENSTPNTNTPATNTNYVDNKKNGTNNSSMDLHGEDI